MAEVKKRIESLTPEQEAQKPIYVDKWEKIGRAVAPNPYLSKDELAIVREQVKKLIKSPVLEKEVHGNEHENIFVFKSPVAMLYGVYHWIHELKEPMDEYIVRKEAEGFTPTAGKEENYLKELLKSSINFGNLDAAFLSIYDYYFNVLELYEEVAPLLPLIEMAKYISWWQLYQGAFFCSIRPKALHFSPENKLLLHRNIEPAIQYWDGSEGKSKSAWQLNGIVCPRWLVEAKEGQLKAEDFFKLKNAEVEREFVRKFGIENLLSALGATVLEKRMFKVKTTTVKVLDDLSRLGNVVKPLDTTYELLGFSFQGTDFKYLKMENPSLPGVFHVEGVHPDCKTVMDALSFRITGELGHEIVIDYLT